MSDDAAIAARWTALRARADAAARRAGRDPASVCIVGAAKRQTRECVAAAVRAGLRDIGENYVQEAAAKRPAVEALVGPELAASLRWHGIGALQTNKAKEAVARFDWLHAVDSLRLARRLDRCAAEAGREVRVLLQLNLSGEPTKSGVGFAKHAMLAGWMCGAFEGAGWTVIKCPAAEMRRRGSKLPVAVFNADWGYSGQTSEHARDAAYTALFGAGRTT